MVIICHKGAIDRCYCCNYRKKEEDGCCIRRFNNCEWGDVSDNDLLKFGAIIGVGITLKIQRFFVEYCWYNTDMINKLLTAMSV